MHVIGKRSLNLSVDQISNHVEGFLYSLLLQEKDDEHSRNNHSHALKAKWLREHIPVSCAAKMATSGAENVPVEMLFSDF